MKVPTHLKHEPVFGIEETTKWMVYTQEEAQTLLASQSDLYSGIKEAAKISLQKFGEIAVLKRTIIRMVAGRGCPRSYQFIAILT